MANPIVIVQGGQYGSEGKGQVAAALCLERNIAYAVRTGAINAGHTVYHDGHQYKMQQLPTGWVNPGTELVIGPGAYIHEPTLLNEISIIAGRTGEDITRRLWIDYRAGEHDDVDTTDAQHAGRGNLIGATGKGCAEAIIRKIRDRGVGYKPYASRHRRGLRFTDTSTLLNRAYDAGQGILLEGTQGTMLDLHLGPYPYTTSRMTTAANWIAEAGLSPSLEYEVVLVMRTFPIRVAGNSGPLPNEISWVTMGHEINRRLAAASVPLSLVHSAALDDFQHHVYRLEEKYGLPAQQHLLRGVVREQYGNALRVINTEALDSVSPEHLLELKKLVEMTTVTRLVRRIARSSHDQAAEAIRIERPASLVLSFLNYQFPEMWGATELKRTSEVDGYLSAIEDGLKVPIDYVTTGPLTEHVLRV